MFHPAFQSVLTAVAYIKYVTLEGRGVQEDTRVWNREGGRLKRI